MYTWHTCSVSVEREMMSCGNKIWKKGTAVVDSGFCASWKWLLCFLTDQSPLLNFGLGSASFLTTHWVFWLCLGDSEQRIKTLGPITGRQALFVRHDC